MEIKFEEVKNIVNTLKEHTVFDFTEYSEKSLHRRIERFLISQKLTPLAIITRIKSDSKFVRDFVNAITVNTTEIFRDPPLWYSLRYEIY